jgi:hypothetical protein
MFVKKTQLSDKQPKRTVDRSQQRFCASAQTSKQALLTFAKKEKAPVERSRQAVQITRVILARERD